MLCSLYRDNGWNVYCDYSSKFDEAADSLSFTQDFSWHDFLKDCLEHFFDIPRDVMYNMESNVFLSYKTKGSFFRPGRLTEEGKKKALLDLNSIYTSIEQAMFAHPIFFYCTHKYGLTVNSDDTLLTLPEFERAKKLVDVLLKGFRSIPIDPYPSDYGPYIIKSALDKLIRNPKHALSSLGDDQKSKDIKLLIPPHSRPVN
jgi:hypothetical protein